MACCALLYKKVRRASQELELRSEVKGQRSRVRGGPFSLLKINKYFNNKNQESFRHSS